MRSVSALTEDEADSLSSSLSSRLGIQEEAARALVNATADAVSSHDPLDGDVRVAVFFAWETADELESVSDEARDQAMSAIFDFADAAHPLRTGLTEERAETVSRFDSALAFLSQEQDEADRHYFVEDVRDALAPHSALFPTQDAEDDAVFRVVSALADPELSSNEAVVSSLVHQEPAIEEALKEAARASLTRTENGPSI